MSNTLQYQGARKVKNSGSGRIWPFTLLLFAQCAIVITGGAVRLTGSGLGCPTWPECTVGSYTPVPHQAQGQLHAWIEFGNRLLTFVLFLAAVVCLAITIRRKIKGIYLDSAKSKKSIGLALGQVLGIFGQAILGGITVLTNLNPIPVAGHFLLSIILISGAYSLRQTQAGSFDLHLEVDQFFARLIKTMLFLTALVLIVGTVVTGSGPHAGDENAKRFNLDVRTISWIHADLVIALVAITFATWVFAKYQKKSLLSKNLLRVFALQLSQGAIGYVQYFTGVPELLVGLHMLGAVLVWLNTWAIFQRSQIKLRTL